MRNILLFVLLLLIISCEQKKEVLIKKAPLKHDGYHIVGTYNTIHNFDIYLQKKLTNKKFVTLKTTQVIDNKFSFSDKIDEPSLYFLGFNNTKEKIPLIASNFQNFITINKEDISKSTVIGSPLQTLYNTYLVDLGKAKNKFAFDLVYIRKNSSSPLAAIILKQMLGKTKWRLGQNKKAFETMSKGMQNSKTGKEINAYIMKFAPKVEKEESIAEVSLDPKISNEIPPKIIAKKAAAVIQPRRKKAPNFYAESINGNDVSLKSLTNNGKVTLIDFWASWCSPCRAQNPHLIKLYNKYHSKGFNIIGVSEDKYVDINKWKNAIANDGLPWHQVIDDNSRIAGMFGVTGIPHTVLLDKNGGIILNKRSTYTVEQELKRIFGF